MGNFFTPWEDGVTRYSEADMNAPMSELDRAIGYLKNVVIGCDGIITYNAATGILAWTDTLEILFNNSAGDATRNTVVAGSVSLAGGEFAYADLSEVDEAAISVSKAAFSHGSASNFITFNRVVFGYRNADSDVFFPVNLKNVQEEMVVLASGASVAVNWDKAKVQEITLGHNAEFTFTGGKNGDRLVLRVKQDGTGGRVPTWPATIRYGEAITEIVLSTDIDYVDYLGFIYDSVDGYYDLVSAALGFHVDES